MGSSSYPMCSSHRVTSPRKTNPTKLNRSVSFSSDPVFKVPQTPPVRASRSSSRPTNFEAIESSCPNCQFQRQDWRSQSLMDLQQRPRSSSLVRPSPSPRGCDSTSASSNNTASIFSNNLRSNSWRNLSLIGQTNEPGASLSYSIYTNGKPIQNSWKTKYGVKKVSMKVCRKKCMSFLCEMNLLQWFFNALKPVLQGCQFFRQNDFSDIFVFPILMSLLSQKPLNWWLDE